MSDEFVPTRQPKATSNLMAIRIGEGGRNWIREHAEKHGVTQTEIIKAALSFAAKREADFGTMVEGRKG